MVVKTLSHCVDGLGRRCMVVGALWELEATMSVQEV